MLNIIGIGVLILTYVNQFGWGKQSRKRGLFLNRKNCFIYSNSSKLKTNWVTY